MCRGPRMQNSNRNSCCVLARVTTLWRERYRTISRFDFEAREIVSRVSETTQGCYGWRLWTEIRRRWGTSEEYYGSGTKLECKFFRLEKWWIFWFLPSSSFFMFPFCVAEEGLLSQVDEEIYFPCGKFYTFLHSILSFHFISFPSNILEDLGVNENRFTV